jgi:hypothetical protein
VFVFSISSTGYLVFVPSLDFEGTFVHNPRSCRVGRGIGLEDTPKLCVILSARDVD